MESCSFVQSFVSTTIRAVLGEDVEPSYMHIRSGIYSLIEFLMLSAKTIA